MNTIGARHWLRLEDLVKVLEKSDDEFISFCEQTQIVPEKRKRGPGTHLSFFDRQVRQALVASGFAFPTNARRISCMMCKGGVGKTTTAFFLAKRLASYGAKVLIVDSDPQSNLTSALRPENFGFAVTENTPVLVDVLSGSCSIKKAILPLTEHLHLLPSSPVNSLLERRLLASRELAVGRPDEVLREVDNAYDYVIFDCAPSINLVNAAIVYASDLVLLPIQLDEFSRSGLKLTLSEIRELQEQFCFKTDIRIILNKFNPNEKLSFLYLGHLASEYRTLMMQSTIRQSAEIKLAISSQKDFFGKVTSKSKEDFDGLAREILQITTLKETNAKH